MLAAGLAVFAQVSEYPRTAVAALARVIEVANAVHQSRIFPRPRRQRHLQPGVKPATLDLQHPAHHRHAELGSVIPNERVPYPDSLAKYAAAFFRIARSSSERASSLFRRTFSRRSASRSSALRCSRLLPAARSHAYRLCMDTPRRSDTSATE